MIEPSAIIQKLNPFPGGHLHETIFQNDWIDLRRAGFYTVYFFGAVTIKSTAITKINHSNHKDIDKNE